MKTSCIRHPANSVFIRRHDWQLEACKNLDAVSGKDSLAETCAEVLSVLEFHTNNRYANEILNGLIKNAMKKNGKRLRNFGEWLPYSVRYLHELLLGGRGKNQIGDALAHLEKIGFVSSDVPDDISEFYSQNMKWYRLEVEAINLWIELHIAKSEDDFNPDDIIFEDVKITEKELKARVKALCEFHRHVHNKTSNTIYDEVRKQKVRARLEEGRTLACCAQAIIGNLLSPHHQGENDKKAIYDDINLIFRDAVRFENHCGYAEQNGVTEKIAIDEFSEFIAGRPIRYTKKPKKEVTAQANGQGASVRHHPTRSNEDTTYYRKFALVIAPFFVNGKSVKYILEECLVNESLAQKCERVFDAELLEMQITSCARNLKQTLPEETVSTIKEFSKRFCEHQLINAEE